MYVGNFKSKYKRYSRCSNQAAYRKDEKVIIKGSDVVTGWEKHEGEIYKRKDWQVNSQQVFVDGFLLKQVVPVTNPSFIAESDGGKNYTTAFALQGNGLEDITVDGSFYYDSDEKVLYIHLPYATGHHPNWYTIEASTRHILFAPGSKENNHGIKWWQILGLLGSIQIIQ
ncbi:MAG: hypothetical protein SNJ70_05520 [Armatimonadota bacterium]